MKTLTGWLCLVMLGGWLVLPALTLAQVQAQLGTRRQRRWRRRRR